MEQKEIIVNVYQESEHIHEHEAIENEKTGEDCWNCGYESDEQDLNDFCPDCGGEVMMYTTLNGCNCVMCGLDFNEEDSLHVTAYPVNSEILPSLKQLQKLPHSPESIDSGVVCESCVNAFELLIIEIVKEYEDSE